MRLLPAALGLAISMAFVQNAAAENILEIYEDAVNNDLVMRAAKAQLRSGQEDVKIARGALLPQVGFNASLSENESENEFDNPTNLTANGSTTTNNQSWNVALQQTIFDMSKWYDFKTGQKLSEQADIKFQQSQQDLIVRTTKAYLDVLRAHNNLESSIAEEKAVKQQLDQTQQRFDVGLVAITDVHESRAVYDLAQVTRLTNEGVLETSYEGLSVLTGKVYSHIQPLQETLPITLPSPAERSAWLELALRGNHDLKAARLSIQAAKFKADSARAKHFPTVSASLGLQETVKESTGTSGFDSAFDGTNTTTAVSINLQIPIYFGGAISANRRKSFAEYEQARQTLGAAERGITQQIRAAHIAVLTSIQEVAARKQSITSSQSALDAIQAGYNYGTRNIVDVLNAQRNLFSSQRDHANARYDYILRLLELKQAAGVLTPGDIQGLNQWISNTMDAKTNPALLPASSRMKISS